MKICFFFFILLFNTNIYAINIATVDLDFILSKSSSYQVFIDKINPMKKRMIKGKLADITKGKVRIHYRMRFPKK